MENGGNWLRTHLWCQTDPRGKGTEDDDADEQSRAHEDSLALRPCDGAEYTSYMSCEIE